MLNLAYKSVIIFSRIPFKSKYKKLYLFFCLVDFFNKIVLFYKGRIKIQAEIYKKKVFYSIIVDT